MHIKEELIQNQNKFLHHGDSFLINEESSRGTSRNFAKLIEEAVESPHLIGGWASSNHGWQFQWLQIISSKLSCWTRTRLLQHLAQWPSTDGAGVLSKLYHPTLSKRQFGTQKHFRMHPRRVNLHTAITREFAPFHGDSKGSQNPCHLQGPGRFLPFSHKDTTG